MRRRADVLQRAAAVNAKDASTWHELGLTYRAQGRMPDAIAALQKAVALDPDMPEPHSNLGIVWLAGGERARAEAAFREAIRIQPDYVDAHSNLGNLLSGTGDFEQARYHFETALRLRPDDAATRYNFAMALGKARHFDEAQQQLEASLRIDPELADAHQLLAELLMAKGQAQAALPHYRELVRIEPESGRALLGLGSALAMSGDFAGALPTCGKRPRPPTPPCGNRQPRSCARSETAVKGESEARHDIVPTAVKTCFGKACLRRGLELGAQVLEVVDNGLRGVTVLNIVIDGIFQDNGIGLQAEGSVIASIGVRRRMPLPAEPRVNRKARADAVVVLEEASNSCRRDRPKGAFFRWPLGARRAEEEVGIRITGVGLGAVIGPRGRIVTEVAVPCSVACAEVDCVGGAVGQIAKTLVAVAAPKRHLMFATDFRQVLVGGVDPLIHPVVPLGTAVRHDQVRADGRETRLAEIIGKAQQGLIVRLRDLISFDIHSLPLLAQNRFGIECRRKRVRESQRAADGRDRDRLVARRAGGQPASGDIGRRRRRIVAQSLLLLVDVGEAEVARRRKPRTSSSRAS